MTLNTIQPTLSDLSTLYDQMREQADRDVIKAQVEIDDVTMRLQGASKSIFENTVKMMLEGFKKENLKILEPELKKEIENDPKHKKNELKSVVKVVAIAVSPSFAGIGYVFAQSALLDILFAASIFLSPPVIIPAAVFAGIMKWIVGN